MTTYKKFFRYASIPALIAIGYLGFVLVWRSLGLPDTKEIIALAENYYEQYGYYTVLVGALIEGALFVNWYLPGSVVVALGVVLSRSAGLNVFLVLFLIILGFYLTALLNYALGRFGWYHVFLRLGLEKPLEKFKIQMEDKGPRILFSTYIHPNFGALSSTAAGILRVNFFKFALMALPPIIVWNTFWAGVFYFFGNALLDHLSLLIVVAGTLIYIMLFGKLKKPKEHLNIP
ncbi:hypothetical protein A3G06_02835 [Candidatus Nomurabacteria bacterium RIFCSPLOWO2_12_FULL_46_14]|uniref:VTT domain-containing protein n=1 Tax=Candidatus Nomurabacteria bacterium RIFCSPLOWO2_12_FULL_46_14 TaxID=1801797 RepID=A0A1F6Y815_9BACT|nr:MAG: hypothetical protein A3G06_02835 [Candidatus Nomurabacteria bacterium RIFCSPLOWO2_12_FULL_46_14]